VGWGLREREKREKEKKERKIEKRTAEKNIKRINTAKHTGEPRAW
jgi:hypothetical protein